MYAELDLGEYDESYKGQTVRLLQNPTRGFRRDFRQSCAAYGSAEWIDRLCVILDADGRAQVEERIAGLDYEVLHWLFVAHFYDWDEESKRFGSIVQPYLFHVWDRYVHERVKAHAGR